MAKSRRGFTSPRTLNVAILVVAAGAFLFRLPRLNDRPMHLDEAVHAVKFGALLDTGEYIYNPREYHGPTIYYFAMPFVRLSGARTFSEIESEAPLRIVPVLFGAGLVALLVGLGGGLGRVAALCAAVLTAISPAMVFYSRYYIQEMVLVFFTFGAIVAGWRYVRTRQPAWILIAGVALGGMRATKETDLIAYAAIAVALALDAWWTRRREGTRLDLDVKGGHLAVAAVLACVVAATFLSAGFTRPQAVIDNLMSAVHYLGRAWAETGHPGGAEMHAHPWPYYLKMLIFSRYGPGPWWSEALIVALAVVGISVALFDRRATGANPRLLRFLAFYTIVLVLMYSSIPYKTPWCMLTFLHGMILMAGVGAAALIRMARGKAVRATVCLLLLAGAGQLGWQAYLGSYRFYVDSRNPYVYAHTSPDVRRMARRIDEIAAVHPDGRDMVVKVVTADYWPLPWLLRRYPNVGYWKTPPDAMPENPDAPVVVMSIENQDELDTRLRDDYQADFFGVRPEVLQALYIRQDLWVKFMEGRQ
jgi:uncharacterized protein (TIGR03663 family)